MFHLIHTESFYLKTTIVVSAYLKLLVVTLSQCNSQDLLLSRVAMLTVVVGGILFLFIISKGKFFKIFETVFVKHDYCRFLHLLFI